MQQKNTLLPFLLSILLGVFFTLSKAQTSSPTGTVSGTILDNKKVPVFGATVRIKGTGLGAATDVDGKYSISNVPVGSQVLQISCIGYVPAEKNIDIAEGPNNAAPDITLKDDALLLNDVVVVGYGTQLKKDISSSVSTVNSDQIENAPAYDFTAALQGQAAGVQITTDNGLAGAATTVRIRGTKTLANSAEPLYVIDGVPIISYDITNEASGGALGYNISPLSNIDPADIESITILKDASATAIYGSRGANGVVVVTTKHGKSGKSKVDFSFETGISQAANVIKLLDGPQYMQLYKEAYANDSADRAAQGLHTPAFNGIYPYGITDSTAANTNWLKQILRLGHYEDANVSVSGGDAKSTYYVGLGFRDDHSFMIDNNFQRASFRTNLTHNVNKYFGIGFNASLTYTYNQYVQAGPAGGLGSAESIMLPIFPVDSPNGKYWNPSINPVAQLNLDTSTNHTYRTISNAYVTFNPIPELTFRSEFGIDMINQLEAFYTSPIVLNADTAIASDRRDFYLTWNLNSTIDYKKDINENNSIDAMIGFNPNETTEKFSYVSQSNFPVNTITQPQGGLNAYGIAGTGRQYAFMSYLARVNYSLFKRFLFQVSVRADGSSRFDVGHRYGYFPAGSVGWIMSEEKFMKKQRALSFFKIRASIGTTGNSEMSTDWAYLSSYSSGNNYAAQTGIQPNNLPYPGLTWETTLKSDVGFDFSFLNGRLSGTIDLYQENTSNVLVSATPLTPSSGFVTATENVGTILNRGAELQLITNNLGPKSKVTWKTIVNIGSNQNKVLSLGGGATEVAGTNYGNNYAVVGQPVGVWLLAQYDGINPETGQIMIDSAEHKVVATAANTVALQKPVGRPYPYFQGGITNTFGYKGLDITVLLTFSYGNQIYDDDGKRQTGDMAFGWNQLEIAENRWTTPGQITNVPRLSLTQNYDLNTTQYLYDASFLRLKTLTIGYTLPGRITEKMKMRQFRIYVSGQNLAVATKYPGWDPETNRDNSGAITQGVSYLNPPQARVYSLGFNIGF